MQSYNDNSYQYEHKLRFILSFFAEKNDLMKKNPRNCVANRTFVATKGQMSNKKTRDNEPERRRF